MRRYIKLASEEITKIDFTQQWPVTPFMSASLNETSIDDVVFSEDGKTGMISYDTLDLTAPHTYSYVTSSGVQQYTVEVGVHGRPVFYDAATMQEITEQEITALIQDYPVFNPNYYPYVKDEKFQYQNMLWKVVKLHTSQPDWLPENEPSLYRKVVPENVIQEWNSELWNSITVGELVYWNGKVYECSNPTFAWIEPGTQDSHYAWTYKYDL